MSYRKIIYLTFIVLLTSFFSFAQKKTEEKALTVFSILDKTKINASPAFAEIVLRQTELRAELESLLINYTEEFPKVAELRFEIDALGKESQRLVAVKAAESSKLTLALGKLLVRKAELETDFWSLQKKYGDDHPDVKRAKRKVEIYENAIKEILN